MTGMFMDKQDIISKVVEILGGDLTEVETNIGNLHATVNEADGGMQSRYESQKSEFQSMASAMEITNTALHNAVSLPAGEKHISIVNVS